MYQRLVTDHPPGGSDVSGGTASSGSGEGGGSAEGTAPPRPSAPPHPEQQDASAALLLRRHIRFAFGGPSSSPASSSLPPSRRASSDYLPALAAASAAAAAGEANASVSSSSSSVSGPVAAVTLSASAANPSATPTAAAAASAEAAAAAAAAAASASSTKSDWEEALLRELEARNGDGGDGSGGGGAAAAGLRGFLASVLAEDGATAAASSGHSSSSSAAATHASSSASNNSTASSPYSAFVRRLTRARRVLRAVAAWLPLALRQHRRAVLTFLACLSLAAALFISPQDSRAHRATLLGVPLYRWLLMAAMAKPAAAAAEAAVSAALAAADGRLVTSKSALFCLVGLRRPLSRLLRVAGAAVAFGLATSDVDIKTGEGGSSGGGGNGIRGGGAHPLLTGAAALLACAALGCAGQVVARVGASAISASFYIRAHAARVQDALDKEYVLYALSQPQPAPTPAPAAASTAAAFSAGGNASARVSSSSTSSFPFGSSPPPRAAPPARPHPFSSSSQQQAQLHLERHSAAATTPLAAPSTPLLSSSSNSSSSSTPSHNQQQRQPFYFDGRDKRKAATSLTHTSLSKSSTAPMSSFAKWWKRGKRGGGTGSGDNEGEELVEGIAAGGYRLGSQGTEATAAEEGLFRPSHQQRQAGAGPAAGAGAEAAASIAEAATPTAAATASAASSSSCSSPPGPSSASASSVASRRKRGATLAALERHVREHRLRLPLADALGPLQRQQQQQIQGNSGEVGDAKEASLLALYLFWHVRGAAGADRAYLIRSDLDPFFFGGDEEDNGGEGGGDGAATRSFSAAYASSSSSSSLTTSASTTTTTTTAAAAPSSSSPAATSSSSSSSSAPSSSMTPSPPPPSAGAAADAAARPPLMTQRARADFAWRLLDADGDGRASAADVRAAVSSIHEQRVHLATTLAGARAAGRSLEVAISAAVHVACVPLHAALLGFDAGRALLTLSSTLLATAFIFGNSARAMYEAALFLFGVHAYDVGDILLIADGAATGSSPSATGPVSTWHQVAAIGLLHTQLQRWDGVRVWWPNARLAAEPVANVSRSAKRWEGLRLAVDAIPAVEARAAAGGPSPPSQPSPYDHVKAAALAHCKAHPSEFTGEVVCVANFAHDPLKFTLSVFWEYSHQGSDLPRMGRARHGLYLAVAAAMKEAGMAFTLPPFPPGGGNGNGFGFDGGFPRQQQNPFQAPGSFGGFGTTAPSTTGASVAGAYAAAAAAAAAPGAAGAAGAALAATSAALSF